MEKTLSQVQIFTHPGGKALALEINKRSNFKFPLLELGILSNDLEIWISTFPRKEVAKWHLYCFQQIQLVESLIYNESWEGLVERDEGEE